MEDGPDKKKEKPRLRVVPKEPTPPEKPKTDYRAMLDTLGKMSIGGSDEDAESRKPNKDDKPDR